MSEYWKDAFRRLLELVKFYMPAELIKDVLTRARGHAGGKSYPKAIPPIEENERLLILTMPQHFSNIDDDMLIEWANRLDDIWLLYQRREVKNLNAEDIVNAFTFVEEELKRRAKDIPDALEIPRLIKKIKDIENYIPKEMTNAQLRDDWRIVCAWWANKRQGKNLDFTYTQMQSLAEKIVIEIAKRKIVTFKLKEMTPYARELFNKVYRNIKDSVEVNVEKQEEGDVHVPGILRLHKPKDFMIVPDFVSLIGSTVESEGNDIDILIRSNDRNESLEIAIRKVLDPEKTQKLHYVYEASGPHDDFVPLWDLVGRCKPNVRITKIKEEDETRTGIAEKFWSENWFKSFPKSGKGNFVYQHHWRGLNEDEVKMNETDLLKTAHSLHGDLRFSFDNSLFGMTIFIGTTKDNANGDRLINWKKDDNLQIDWKLAQPKAWLTIARRKPYISKPTGVGATSLKYAKFFEEDRGIYEIGVWREHMIELFLNGNKIKGKLIAMFAPIGGSRKWLIDRPIDQKPYAEANKIEDIVKELKSKRQKYLIWSTPGSKPDFIDISKWKSDLSKYVPIAKVDDEKRLVYGIVMEPDSLDTQGDFSTIEEIEEACNNFMIRSGKIRLQHSKIPVSGITIVQNLIAPQDLTYEHKGNKRSVRKGSWVMVTHIANDVVWDLVKSGKLTGYSIKGTASHA